MQVRNHKFEGGRTKVECPNCGERDTTKMTLGQRRDYAECHCGFCFDVTTGMGRFKHKKEEL